MQLAQKWKPGWKVWPMYVEPKLDGARCMVYVDPVKKSYEAWARSGNDWTPQLSLVGEQLLRLAKPYKQPFVLDGEMWAGSWGATQSAIKTIDRDRSDLKFMAFDFLTDRVWETGDMTSLTERRKKLEQLVKKPTDNIELIPYFVAESRGDVEKYFHSFLEQGYEGVMIKAPMMGYFNTRSTCWLKYKPFKDVKATVTGVLPGSYDGRHAHRMGRMLVMVDNSDGGGYHKVGGGFSDKQRNEIWTNQKSYIGRRCEVVVQVDPQGNIDYRFPIFKRWLEVE